MSVESLLNKEYPEYLKPQSVDDIPRNQELVYILTYNGKPIIVGRGKYQRAKVIFDGDTTVSTHIKAINVRAYRLFGNGSFDRFLIPCKGIGEAKAVEKTLHKKIGGNNRNLPSDIREALFDGIDNAVAHQVLQMALHSSYCGLADLRSWRRKGILKDDVWCVISQKLELPEPGRKKTKG